MVFSCVFMMFWVDLYLSYLLSEVLLILKLLLSLSFICIAAYPISGVIRIWIWRDPFPKAGRSTWGLHNVEHWLKALKWEWHKNGSVRSLRFGPGRDIHPSLKPISIWVKFCIREKHRKATAKGFPVGLPSLPWPFLAKDLASIWVTFSCWWLVIDEQWTCIAIGATRLLCAWIWTACVQCFLNSHFWPSVQGRTKYKMAASPQVGWMLQVYVFSTPDGCRETNCV